MYEISLNDILKYNQKVVPSLDAASLSKTLNYNKRDIRIAIREFYNSGTVITQSINDIRKNLKKKNKKFVICKDNNEGNLYSLGADIDLEENSYHLVMLPIGDYKDKPNAKIIFRHFKRNKYISKKFEQLIVMLRSNKITFEYEFYKEKNINKFRLEVQDPRCNEKFWKSVNFWAKH